MQKSLFKTSFIILISIVILQCKALEAYTVKLCYLELDSIREKLSQDAKKFDLFRLQYVEIRYF